MPSATFRDPHGHLVAIEVVDTGTTDGDGNVLYKLAVDASLSTGPITIGAVNIQDANSLVNADVNTVTAITESNHGLAVQAPVLGAKADTTDQTGGATTINAKLRGLVQMVHDVWNSTVHALGVEGKGVAGTGAGGVLTVQGDPSGTALPVSLASNIELGEVRIIDGLTGNLAQVDAVSAITETGATKQAVHDPTVGISTGTKVITDAAGTVQQYLRGLVTLFAGVLNGSKNAIQITSIDVGTQVLTPTNQASTNAYVDFAGSTLDTLDNSHCSYTLLNLDVANGLTWQILAANRADFSDAFVNNAGAVIAAGAVGHAGIAPANFRYYKVQIVDTVPTAHATGQLTAVAKV